MASKILNGCTNCGICVDLCPTKSILPGTAIHAIDTDTCMDCKICVPHCPVRAIVPGDDRELGKKRTDPRM